jgi:hypothetical protein
MLLQKKEGKTHINALFFVKAPQEDPRPRPREGVTVFL